MKYRIAIAAGAAFFLTHTAAIAADDDAKRLKLAEELIETSQAGQIVDQMLTQMAPLQAQIIKAAAPDDTLTDDQAKELATYASGVMAEEMRPAVAELVRKMAPIYAEFLTTEELQGILDFYHSPAGKALLEKQPQMMQRSIAISAQWAQETLPGVMARTKPRIEEKLKTMRAAE